MDGKQPRAEHHYETAILLCGRRGMLNSVWAMAHQRRGEFFFRKGNLEDARHDLNKAISLYQDWGALAKCEQLQEKYKDLLVPPTQIETSNLSLSLDYGLA